MTMTKVRRISFLLLAIYLITIFSPALAAPMTDSDVEFHELNISEALAAYKGYYTATLSSDKECFIITTSANLVSEIDDSLYRWGISRSRFKVMEKTADPAKTPSPTAKPQTPSPTTAPKEPAQTPELQIISCIIAPDPVYETEEFTVEATIKNLSEVSALNVILTYGSDAMGILPVTGENTIQLGHIEGGAPVTATFRLMAMDSVQAGDSSLGTICQGDISDED